MGKVIWFTGLSGSGKTTVANALEEKLKSQGKSVLILDGDAVRDTSHKHLGFSREDIKENNRLIAELAKEKIKQFDFILVPIISPYREDREMVRSIVGENFIELYVNTSLDKCIERDVKGLYKKALAGDIPNFIGIAESNPYEIPESPEINLDTSNISVEESVKQLLNMLEKSNS